jgi:chaperonin GroEL
VALLRASKALALLQVTGDERVGVNIVIRAIEEPMRWIATNAGHDGAIVVQRVREMAHDEGFNAQTERYEDLVQAGVIDPTKVVRSAIQHAASIASLLLTTEAVVASLPEQHEAAAPSPGGMGGGMF